MRYSAMWRHRRVRSLSFVVSCFAALALSMAVAPPFAAGQARPADHPRVREASRLLDVWLDAEVAYGRIPSLAVAIVHDQAVVWAKGYGYADAQRRIDATPRTLYRACSIVKLFTATGVMQLEGEGRLRLDDPVSVHLPWARFGPPGKSAAPITLESLLTHSSGLPRDLPYPYWTGPGYPFPTREQIVDRVPGVEPVHPARTRSGYSNVGMTLAGEVVAAVSGTSFGEYVRERIFEPLGMDDSSIDEGAGPLDGRLATGYSVLQRDGSRLVVPPYRTGGLAPAAGLVTSVEDLARFASWQFRTLDGRDGRILDADALREMQRVQWMEPDGWSRSGYGYQTWAENDRHFVGHAGACPGHESKMLLQPQEKIATIVMTNSQGPNVDAYAQRAYDMMAPALRAAQADGAVDTREPASEADRFTGLYRRPFGGEMGVIPWRGGLALVRLPTSDPLRSLERFAPVAEGRFRGEGPGDEIRFEKDETGRMRFWRNHQFSVRALTMTGRCGTGILPFQGEELGQAAAPSLILP